MKSLLSDELTQQLIHELGIEGAPEDAQQEFLSGLGKNIISRLTIEMLAILPAGSHAGFQEVIEAGSPIRLYDFLSSFIADVPAFIERIARDEVTQTKALLQH